MHAFQESTLSSMQSYFGRRKALTAFVVLVMSFVGTFVVAQPVHANHGRLGPQYIPGTTTAFLLWEPSTALLSGTGNTVGWSTGTIKIKGTLYHNNVISTSGTYPADGSYLTCLNTTYCTLPSWMFCPVSGTWLYRVIGTGPGGSDTSTRTVII
jgi:hypothetical protein